METIPNKGGHSTKLMPPALLDFPEAAAMLAISTRHLRRLADSGRGPRPVRLGKAVRFRLADIEEFVANGCAPAMYRRVGK
jgi:excisionase family DNA binding protein